SGRERSACRRPVGRTVLRALSLIWRALLLSVALVPAAAGQSGEPDPDPLRRLLPSPELYMPVPGGQLGLTGRTGPGSIEELKAKSDGGMVVGYCLRSSCNRITHLVVLQVCG